jgi:YVTN family beta-propeller protein
MANTTGGAAVAVRPADSVWLSTLPTPRIAAVSGSARPSAELLRAVRPAAGELAGLPGAVTDLAVSHDGRFLVAAHFGADAVSVIDVATLSVKSVVSGIAEPYAVAASDRAYVRSACISEDNVVAVDLDSGFPLADREVGVGARGLAVSRSGDLVYVARSSDEVADVAVVDVETGQISTIVVARESGASIDAVQINPAGSRLYAALTTAAGGALVVIDLRSGRVLDTIAVGASIGDIAVHADDRRVVVTGWDAEIGGVLRVIDTSAGRVLHTIEIGADAPAQVVVTGGAAYVADGDGVVVVDTATARVGERIDIGRPVSALAVSRDGSCLYVGDYEGVVSTLEVRSAGLRAAS